ncbi:ABC transporter ATP-binding protein [Streptomyces sp. NPDC058295]|uniref:ABC transporter ATP-binding protein n=1 Tax=Streptomyces sp. NPDC058295 TaxID=3346431 RepID=UPI0036E58A7B
MRKPGPRDLTRSSRLATLGRMLRLSYLAAPLVTVVNVALIALLAGGVAVTALSQRLIVESAGDHALPAVFVAAGLGVVAHGASFILQHIQAEVRQDLTVRTARQLDHEILGLTARIPTLDHLERPDFLDRVTNLRRGTQALAASAWRVAQAAAALVSLGLSAWLLATIHPGLPLLALCATPLLLLTSRGRRHFRSVRDNCAEDERLERELHDLCLRPDAAKEIRIAGSGPVLSARATELWERTTVQLNRARLQAVAWETLGWILFAASLGGALALTVHLYSTGLAAVGDLVMLVTLGSALSRQIEGALFALGVVAEAGHVTRHYVWLKEYAAKQPQGTVPAPARLAKGISLRGVGFSYPGTDTPVLSGIDVDLAAGSVVALVGVNGAGKTTLVKLLTGMYRPDTGTVTVDGMPVADLDQHTWSARCTGTFQDFARLQLVLRESVGVGELSRSHVPGAVEEAMRRAGAEAVVRALPEGYDTQLGTVFGGAELSHGQWQKLALARGLLRRDPLLLVLDEPTSALDPQAEHDLFDRFTAQARDAAARLGAITVLVSHRFSTVHMADHIVVLDDGRVVEQGGHAELLAANGPYAQLFTAQAAAYGATGPR